MSIETSPHPIPATDLGSTTSAPEAGTVSGRLRSEAPGAGSRHPGRAKGGWSRRLAGVALAAVVGAGVAATGYAVSGAGRAASPLGPGVVTVEVGIHHSRYDIGTLRVREGTIVEFVLRNDDPIDHELVVGTAEVHERHRTGNDRQHPPIPGEVSVAPGDTAKTYYEFGEAGTVEYACHLPAHEAYGMRGEIEVVPAG